MCSDRQRRLQRLLDEEYQAGRISTAFAWSQRGEREPLTAAVGEGAGSGLPPDESSLFDLASLTKPLVATLALRLDAAGQVPLATRLGEVYSDLHPQLSSRTVEDLLRHRAGFAPWFPLYALDVDVRGALRWLRVRPPLGARRGTYSDLGFVFYGQMVESMVGPSLSELLQAELGSGGATLSCGRTHGALGCYLTNRKEVELARGLGLEITPRGRPEAGVVQDGNAQFLGGCAGHAGLFSDAQSLVRVAGMWLDQNALGPARVQDALGGPLRFPVGWRRRPLRGSAGNGLGPRAFGHIGFTGGSLWIDPDSRGIHLLLAHRTSTEVDLAAVRRRFHRLGNCQD